MRSARRRQRRRRNQPKIVNDSDSSFHRIDLIQIGRLIVPVNGNDQRQADGGFGGGNGNRENHEDDAGEGFGIRTDTARKR